MVIGDHQSRSVFLMRKTIKNGDQDQKSFIRKRALTRRRGGGDEKVEEAVG